MMIEMLGRFISRLEDTPVTVAGWLATFLGVLWIRYLLEAFSSPDPNGFLPSTVSTLVHFTMYYLATVTLTVVTVSAATRISALRMMRAVLFVLPIMWLGPLVDLSRGVYAKMSYVPVATPADLVHYFFTFFGPLTGFGATLGLRIELGILIVLIGVYVYTRTSRLTAALLGSFLTYVWIFVTFTIPSIISFVLPAGGILTALHGSLVYRSFLPPAELYSINTIGDFLTDAILAQTFYLLLCVSSVVWFLRTQKDATIAMLKNVRLARVSHFLTVAVLGALIALAEGNVVQWSLLDGITVTVAALVIVFAWLFAVATNDLADEPIDAISNASRPLITGAVTRGMMRDAAFIFGVMTLLGALALGSYSFFLMTIFTAAYYIYSMPPLRLKRVPMLASALIGIASLCCALLGFFLISVRRELIVFPSSVALLVVLFFTLLTNVRDLKDSAGDASAGISTIPTMLGERRARIIIGALMCLAYILVPLFIAIPALWVPSLIAGVASGIGIWLGFGERYAFALYFTYIVSIVTLLSYI
jgi:4-hydroxybenzoate polyprenyltransferase